MRREAEEASQNAMNDEPDKTITPTPWLGGMWSGSSDEVHSFVLRVCLDALPGGSGPARLQFHLEDVGAGLSWRLTDFDRIVERIRERVSAIEATAPS